MKKKYLFFIALFLSKFTANSTGFYPRLNSNLLMTYFTINPAYSGLDSFASVNFAMGYSNTTWASGGTFEKTSHLFLSQNTVKETNSGRKNAQFYDVSINLQIPYTRRVKFGLSLARSFENMDAWMNGAINKVGLSCHIPTQYGTFSMGA